VVIKKSVQSLQNKIEQSVQVRHQDIVLRQSRFWMRTITWSLITTTGFALVWLATAQTEEIVVASGKLEPIGAVKDIQVPVGGVVDQILVKSGDRVKKNQALLQLDTEATLDRLKATEQSIAIKEQQLISKQTELLRFLELNETQQRVLERNINLQRVILQRLESLSKQGASAELQYLQQRDQVQTVEGQLQESKVERKRQEAIIAQSTDQLRSELAELKSKLTELRINIRYQSVRSPVDGIVFELKPKSRGFVAQGSEPVMKIVPFDKLEARVEIASSDIGFVSIGKRADISIDSFPATDFGVLQGSVRSIGSDALPPDQLKNTYRFPADIQLSSQQLRLKSGRQLPLQVGMSLTANIKLRKVSYLQLLLGSFKDKADSLRRV
jgi:hemolysin D